MAAALLGLPCSPVGLGAPLLKETRYAQVSGEAPARDLAPRVAELIDGAVPRIAPLVGAGRLAPVPAVVYLDRRDFAAATGIPARAGVVGLATFPAGAVHIDGTGSLVAIEKVVPHEVAHVLVGRALGAALEALPAWVNEGIAEYAAGEQASQVDPVTLEAIGRGAWLPLSQLDARLRDQAGPDPLAYAEAASVVHFLVSQRGEPVIAALLSRLRQRGDFESALEQATRWNSQQLESAWRLSVARRWRWPLLLRSPAVPFALMLLIFILGYIRYRRERRRRQEMPERDW